MASFIQELMEYLNAQSKKELVKAATYADDVDMDYDVEQLDEDDLHAEMPSQTGRDIYDVYVAGTGKGLSVECDCLAYNPATGCKHINTVIAAQLAWEHSSKINLQTETSSFQVLQWAAGGLLHVHFQQHATAEKSNIPITGTYSDTGGKWVDVSDLPENIAYNYPIRFGLGKITMKLVNTLEKLEEDKAIRYWKYRFKYGLKKYYEVEIKYDGEITFQFNCTCGKKPACLHVGALLQKLDESDCGYFLQFKNYDREKKKLLAEYGLSINDREAAAFSFRIQYGRIEMLPPLWAVSLIDTKVVETLAKELLPPQKAAVFSRPKPGKDVIIDFEPGFMLNFTGSRLGFMNYELEMIKVFSPKANGQPKFNKIDTHLAKNSDLLKGLPDDVYAIVHSLSKPIIEKYAIEKLGLNNQNYYGKWSGMSDTIKDGIEKYYVQKLRELWPFLQNHQHFYILAEGRFAPDNIIPAKAMMPFLEVNPQIEMGEKYITLSLVTTIPAQSDEQHLPLMDGSINEVNRPTWNAALQKLFPDPWQWVHSFFYVSQQGEIALPATDTDEEWFSLVPGGLKRIPIQHKESVIKSLIPAIEERLGRPLTLPVELRVKRITATPQSRILVTEYMEKYLMLMPQFSYNGHVVDFNRRDTEIWLEPSEYVTEDSNDKMNVQAIITRESATEMAFYESLRPLHPTFARQTQNDFFYLPFDQVMQQQWFIKTIHSLAEANVSVFGIEKLKKFRYSALKPKWEMKASSQTDWFDLKIEVTFGDEIIPLKTIRKALGSGQQVIMLNDGSLGVLPEEWLKQYGALLKMGQEKEPGVVRLSKLHYTLIEALHDEIDDEVVMAELEEKKQRLLAIENVTHIALPKDIKAKLRPYQVSGFLWMNTMEQMGWGGCLADDMGLGKTLQTITFLQHLKKQYPGTTHLVVCPTSLLYNWENELRKFAPKLKFWVHYGLVRQLTEDEFKEHDIIITSYGLVRSDIELLKSFQWHYLILDESQAIKNPDALTTRALHLIKAKNRLILSGTPLQNNTFDLYAQFNFLNPGMLGSREFFREEFANPIDKNRDPHKAETLRRMLHPFMLRRTKAQVAPELPAKTESILWCDMPKEQQEVYDAYKLQYRQALMQKIEETGMGKAGMLILEGLLRLRQICNSPQLLKQQEYTTRASVKIDELMREINENTGGHKLLVFSQFTEMLHLIEAELQQLKIGYAYLDGSTPAAKRKEAVELFQEKESIRVFLISLKAGGVGLNLTAADYVYLVDPWWNPAAEQQAIDRTHRIGQTQKIFAYKMICRNTVEEKILELQNRKRKLAGDLVGEDEAVAKNLTKEDVAFLFS